MIQAIGNRFRQVVRLVLLAWLLFALLTASFAMAQPTSKPFRIGTVHPGPAEGPRPPIVNAFVEGMREHGLIEGRDYVFDDRGMPDDKLESYVKGYVDLLRVPVDLLLVGPCGVPTNAARKASQTIPIVVVTCNEDLVETGLVKSLSKPGGNITGQSKLTPELAAKRLSLLKEMLPNLRDVAVLWNPDYADFKADWRELNDAATRLSVSLHSVEFRRPDDFERAFDVIRQQHVDAIMMFSDVQAWAFANRVAKLAASSRLPMIAPFREITDGGALMSYGPNIVDMWRHAASFVAAVMKGAKAGDLPIEQPTRLELIVNLRAATALGLTVPPGVLLRADEIIR